MSLAGSLDPSEFAIPELAHGRSRAAGELRKLSKGVQSAYNGVAAAKATVRKRRDDLADQHIRLADAKAEVDFTHKLVRDPGPRPIPTIRAGGGSPRSPTPPFSSSSAISSSTSTGEASSCCACRWGSPRSWPSAWS